jgi:hypothetical protein
MRRTASILLAFAMAGCAAKRLPPGTPAPEYEVREAEPWSGDTPDAGAPTAPAEAVASPAEETPAPPAASDQPKTEPAPVDAGASPSPDAGVR